MTFPSGEKDGALPDTEEICFGSPPVEGITKIWLLSTRFVSFIPVSGARAENAGFSPSGERLNKNKKGPEPLAIEA